MRTALTLAVLLTLALPVHATGPVLLTASSLTATGTLTATGGLVAATVHDPLNGTTQEPGFTLTAATLRIETDSAVAVRGPGAELPADPETTQATYTAATVAGVALRDGFRLDVVAAPLASLQLETSCAIERASSVPRFEVESWVDFNRAPIQRDTAATVNLQACQDAALIVEGDFGVSLWTWDSRLHAAEGDRDLPSGFTPGTGDGPVSVGRVEQHYLWATDGRLTLPLAADAKHRLYASAHTLALNGTATFTGATVEAPGLEPVALARAVLGGSGALQVEPQAGKLRAVASGDFTLTANGATLYDSRAALPTPTGTYGAWAPWAVATGLLVVLLWLLPALAGFILAPRYTADWPSWRQARGFFWCSLSRLPPMARLASVAARRAHANHPGADALAALADAHGAAGQPGAEIEVRERLEGVLPKGRPRATNAVAAARAAIALNDPQEAMKWLMAAHDHDPFFTERQLADPAFAILANRPWIRLTLIDSRLGFA